MTKVIFEGQLYGFDRDGQGDSFWYNIGGDRDNIIVSMTLARELNVLASQQGLDIRNAKAKDEAH